MINVMTKHSKTPLIDAMLAYGQTSRLRFHVPGHNGQHLAKLQAQGILPDALFQYDYTELEGLDVLSEPESCLLQSQEEAAKTFGVGHSFYLVNGASVGIMAAMLSLLSPGDKVLLPRNIHRSVISGLVQTGAEPIWCLPEQLETAGLWGALSPMAVKHHLQEHPDIKLVMVTSPTYEGIGSDIASILQVCRQYGAKLVVDEAHGSLWPFNENLPRSACHVPCDVVIHSLHKTAGSITQGAIAHLPIGSRVDASRFQQALNMLQTTSPSYLLLASLEATQAYLGSDTGKQAIQQLLENSDWIRKQFKEHCKRFGIYTPDNTKYWDPTKLWMQHQQWAGTDWAVIVESEATPHGIAYESATPEGALYLCGLGLKRQDYQQFFETFQNWDQCQDLDMGQKPLIDHSHAQGSLSFTLPQIAMSPREAFFSEGYQTDKQSSIGKVSKQTIVHCPPGIAVLFPGEVIDASLLPQLPEVVEVCQVSYPIEASRASTIPTRPQTPGA